MSNRIVLQDDLSSLVAWLDRWSLEVNPNKSVVMQLNNSDESYDYTLRGFVLHKARNYKDLGVILSNDLKTTSHCKAAAAKGYRVLWSIRRSFQYLDDEMFGLLYPIYVQPHLEYGIQVASRRDSHRRPFESAYEGPFKVLQRESKYYIVDKNETNDSISIVRLKAAYLEGNPIYVDFPSVQSHNTTPTLIIPQPTTNTSDDTPNVSDNKPKTTRSGRRVRFPEHLNDYCT
ncbi:hypothetical protein MS3_00008900 [Schistosoma haematobium]|nr:uncharacterized protein MS3_00004726 [Schistosoma haematobium]XP_051064137.1 uncharacterized protein MS3_00008897 [Schistosoma haematobium]XP_051064139.1 uncharacterized protein MS3_00008899 [Schistosoma haematobium]XP_051064140.1 uncharacterized protein MS3_00008900 [Schistosoma haematobium]KAH9578555.1 hypothetical protein MS3_00004726 [Schistosoma haematobium]KAH9579077.1 hypothetical protein MS3_00008897 [Schistosoma haematobium]KAH9579079.1 hypothetical protein MS3_00008899 [Schistoso